MYWGENFKKYVKPPRSKSLPLMSVYHKQKGSMTKTSIVVKPLNASQENSTTLVINSKHQKHELRNTKLFFKPPQKKMIEII